MDFNLEREREFTERGLLMCPFYGTDFCKEECPSSYEKCDRFRELNEGITR